MFANFPTILPWNHDIQNNNIYFISFENICPYKLNKIQVKGLKCIPQRFVEEKIASENLVGNKFTILIRDFNCSVEECETEIEKTVDQIHNLGGLPNYYGPQRFGTIRPITHLIGEKLVKRKFTMRLRKRGLKP